MQTLAYLKSRRLWIVRDVLIWGLASDALFHYLGVENVSSEGRIMFGMSSMGDASQNILYADLIDQNGNALPPAINSPRVLVRPRSNYGAYLAGDESASGFRIVRDSSAPGPISVDFFIFETGLIE
jgi:hypothetical protein